MVYACVLVHFIVWSKHGVWRQAEEASSVSQGFLGNGGSSAVQATMLGGPRGPTLAACPSYLPCIHLFAL